MNETEFYSRCKQIVTEYVSDHFDPTDGDLHFDVYIVWMCKTLQNSKALLSTDMRDGMYYEITYDGDKNAFYLDAYKKWENKRIPNDF